MVKERFGWGNVPTYYQSLHSAAESLAELMDPEECHAATDVLLEPLFGRFNRVDITFTPLIGWVIHYTDNNSFVRYLQEFRV